MVCAELFAETCPCNCNRQSGTPPREYLAFLSEIGLRVASFGVRFGKKLAPDWRDQNETLEVEYATTFRPWFYSPSKLTLSQLKEITDQRNLAGEQCKAAGLKLAVHNHNQEFRELDGKPIFDRLLEMTEPDLVTVEMDLCWAVKGGADPVGYFRRYPKRIQMLHVKDLGPAPEYAMVPVGSGTIDFARIFARGLDPDRRPDVLISWFGPLAARWLVVSPPSSSSQEN